FLSRGIWRQAYIASFLGSGNFRIKRFELLTGAHDQLDVLVLAANFSAIFLSGGGIARRGNPPAHSFLFDRRCKRLVEIGVAVGKDSLMGQFMKQDSGQIEIFVMDKSVEHRILEPA